MRPRSLSEFIGEMAPAFNWAMGPLAEYVGVSSSVLYELRRDRSKRVKSTTYRKIVGAYQRLTEPNGERAEAIPMRQCTACRAVLPLPRFKGDRRGGFFHENQPRAGGIGTMCKRCRKAQRKHNQAARMSHPQEPPTVDW